MAKNPEILCIAPDGSLEIWCHPQYGMRNDIVGKWGWEIERRSDDRKLLAFAEISDTSKDIIEPPEFFGRIVLEENFSGS